MKKYSFIVFFLVFSLAAYCQDTVKTQTGVTVLGNASDSIKLKIDSLPDELITLSKCLPAGWEVIADSVSYKQQGGFWYCNVTLTNKSLNCQFEFNQKSHNINPSLLFHFYKKADRSKVFEFDRQNAAKSTSAFCPRSIYFYETKRYFIALSPCNRNSNLDANCMAESKKLEKSLKEFLSKYK